MDKAPAAESSPSVYVEHRPKIQQRTPENLKMLERTPPGSPTGWLATALARVTTASPTIPIPGRHMTHNKETRAELHSARNSYQPPYRTTEGFKKPKSLAPVTPCHNSTITSLLEDAFQQFYGDGWEEAYRQPAIKDFFLREVREELAKGTRRRSTWTAVKRTEPTHGRDTPACSPPSTRLQ